MYTPLRTHVDAGDIELIDASRERRLVGLFDIRDDYYEKESMGDRQLTDITRAAFYELYADSIERRLSFASETAVLSEETVEQLRSLGYLD